MPKKSQQKSILSKVVSKKVLDSNKAALKSFGYYKKTSDLIDRTNFALGKKPTFKANSGSTLNFKINRYAVSSTTAQKI